MTEKKQKHKKMENKIGKTHEYKGKIYSEIPEEVAETLEIKPGEDLQFKNPYKDTIILTPKQTEEEKSKKDEDKKELGPIELETLQKIGKIKHWERTPENIKKKLNKKEEEKYEEMTEENILFEYTKEGEKRIGIEREYFPLATGKKEENEEDPNKQSKNKEKIKKTSKKQKNLLEQLEEKKHLVVKDEEKAREFQKTLRKKEMGEDVKGVRDFNKKYYIIKEDELRKIEEEIEEKDILEEEKSIEKTAEKIGRSKTMTKAALVILREEGKVVEKGKDIYQTT